MNVGSVEGNAKNLKVKMSLHQRSGNMHKSQIARRENVKNACGIIKKKSNAQNAKSISISKVFGNQANLMINGIPAKQIESVCNVEGSPSKKRYVRNAENI